jgi:hypothetical protein
MAEEGKRETEGVSLTLGAVTQFISRVRELPVKEKGLESLMKLSQIFEQEGVGTEIEAAIGRGYSFGDLAKILAECSGVAVSDRQLKYHLTRARNKAEKSKKPSRSERGRKTVSPDGKTKARDENVRISENVSRIEPDSHLKTDREAGGEVEGNQSGSFTISREEQEV